MAILLVQGTDLESVPAKVPLNRPFIYAIGFMYLFAIHLPFLYHVHTTEAGLQLPYNVITWIAFNFVIAIGILQVVRTQKLRYSKLTIGLLLCCGLMTLPLMYHQSAVDSAIYRILALWGGFLLFLTMQQFCLSNQQKHRLIWFIVLSTLIEGCLAYYQLFFQTNTPDDIPLGVFPTPHTFATFLATGLLASGYLLCRHLKKYQKQISIVALLYLTPCICIPLLIISRSVIGWSVTGIGGIVIFPYLYQFASRKRLWGWSISICLGIIVGLTYTQLTYYEAFHKYNLAGVPQLKTSLVQTLDMFIEKPFTGYGYGRFEEEYVLYSARQHQLNPSYPPPQPKLTHPHNELLYWGIEGGILPLIAIALAALFVSFRIHSAKQKTRLASLSLLFPVILHSQLDNVFSLSSIHWITLITLIFWTDQRVAKYRNLPLSTITTKFLHLVLYIVPLAVCLYMAGILRTQFLLSQYDKHHDVTLLDAIHFPFIWEDRLMQDRLALVLKQTDQTQKNRQLPLYIDWLLHLIKREPRPEYYQTLISVYQQTGDINRAEQTRIEAHFLFPHSFSAQAN